MIEKMTIILQTAIFIRQMRQQLVKIPVLRHLKDIAETSINLLMSSSSFTDLFIKLIVRLFMLSFIIS